jgi:acetolactate synthase-1/2/3 large subunit
MINIGARFDDRVTGRLDGFSPKSRKIHVDIDASSINKIVHVDLPIVGDAGEVIEMMIALWRKKKLAPQKDGLSKWWKQIEEWRSKDSFGFKNDTRIIKPQHALRRLNHAVKGKDFFVTTDVGQHQMWAAQHILYDKPGRWMTSGGLGTMGYGLPAALGVQIAHPKKPVICVTGEASFMMNIQELETIKHNKLPVKIFVLNNNGYISIKQTQKNFFDGHMTGAGLESGVSVPDFIKVGNAFGLKTVKISKVSEMAEKINDVLKANEPVLCEVMVNPDYIFTPKLSARKLEDGTMLSPSLEDMFPFLDRDEFEENIIK